ncbi:MAG: proline dehydrogenase [Acidobacteria bacterium]|nr:MAG: proline dehydrogenase [Acidobacteriota bacterium]
MGIMRDFFLACSTSPWLRERATRYGFVRRAVSRFMPGEAPSDAIGAGLALRDRSIGSVFTYLGENVSDPTEAQVVTEHYLDLLDRVRKSGLGAEVSVKLTQLGLDLSPELCHANLKRIIEHADAKSVVWIDMEASDYVDATLDLYRRARAAYPNVGVCLQAYLYRTAEDLRSLVPLGAAIRLVKGAYKEPADRAFPRKKDVDENYFALAERLLADEARAAGVRAAMATHDLALIRRIIEHAESRNLGKSSCEFQMLYGIQREAQWQLAREGWKSMVLIAYGSYWFPWYMRRLAERPPNVFFVLRNLLPTSNRMDHAP